jgi:hypothetical protein
MLFMLSLTGYLASTTLMSKLESNDTQDFFLNFQEYNFTIYMHHTEKNIRWLEEHTENGTADTAQWEAFVNMVMNPWDPKTTRNFLTTSTKTFTMEFVC